MVDQESRPWEIQFSQEASEHSHRLMKRSAELRAQAVALFATSEQIRNKARALCDQFEMTQRSFHNQHRS
jgi:hypothetical protein